MPNSERKKIIKSLINTKPRFCLILPQYEASAAAHTLSCKGALSDATTGSCRVVTGHTACLQDAWLGMGQKGGSPGDAEQTPDALSGLRPRSRAHLPGA